MKDVWMGCLYLFLAACFAYIGFEVGFMRGRSHGYSVCVAEEDEDYPRGYGNHGRLRPKL